jgi:hypothetical protein
MYHEKMLAVCKITNGFLIEVRAPYKRKKESDKKESCCCAPSGMGYGEKEIFAKDAAELGAKIEALIPMLDEEFESEDAFEGAFKMVK